MELINYELNREKKELDVNKNCKEQGQQGKWSITQRNSEKLVKKM